MVQYEMNFTAETNDGVNFILDNESINEIVKATSEVTPKDIKKARRKKLFKRFMKSDFMKLVRFWLICFLIGFSIIWMCFMFHKEQVNNFHISSNLVAEHYQDSPSFSNFEFTDELENEIKLHKIDLYGINIGQRLGDDLSAFLEETDNAKDGTLERLKIVGSEERQSEWDDSTYMCYIIGLND